MRFLVAAAVLFSLAPRASAAITASEASRLAAGTTVVREVRSAVSQDLWNRARCIVAIPELKKAAVVAGAEDSKGMMSCRAGDGWSAPAFFELAKGSWRGLQAGVEPVDLVLLVMNESGVQKLLDNKVTLGADTSVAVGQTGRQAQAVTGAEILAYSRANGLVAGIDLSGGVLRPDANANRNVYGDSATPRTVLASRALSAPTEAAPFLQALNSVDAAGGGKSAAAPAAASPPQGRASADVPPTADSDLRVRIVAMQQTLDRLISDASSRPVGTSGSSAPETIAVDRTRLMQLRQQLDALLSALDKR
jgi:SH3 domain-containing YSC84-like protein 1